MAFQSVPETAEATPIFLVNGQLIQNTYHGRKSGGYSTADLEAFAEAVDLSVAAHQLPLLSTEVTYAINNIIHKLNISPGEAPNNRLSVRLNVHFDQTEFPSEANLLTIHAEHRIRLQQTLQALFHG